MARSDAPTYDELCDMLEKLNRVHDLTDYEVKLAVAISQVIFERRTKDGN